MANFQAFPPAGRSLPRGWEAEAAKNAAEAQARFESSVCQAWRRPSQAQPLGIMQAARIQQQPPAAPPRRDSRADARMDGMMLLVKDDDLEQVWKDDTGRLVTIKKRK